MVFVDVSYYGSDHCRYSVIRRHDGGLDPEVTGRVGRDWTDARDVDSGEQVDRLLGADRCHEIADARSTCERDDVDLSLEQQTVDIWAIGGFEVDGSCLVGGDRGHVSAGVSECCGQLVASEVCARE